MIEDVTNVRSAAISVVLWAVGALLLTWGTVSGWIRAGAPSPALWWGIYVTAAAGVWTLWTAVKHYNERLLARVRGIEQLQLQERDQRDTPERVRRLRQ